MYRLAYTRVYAGVGALVRWYVSKTRESCQKGGQKTMARILFSRGAETSGRDGKLQSCF